MNELRVPPGPGIPDGLVIPGPELSEQFSRASGPGGQGVNTTDSRVQLSLDLATTTALT
ncbi:MAG: peptide chain release factor-like protein, partial [Janibacter sp.]